MLSHTQVKGDKNPSLSKRLNTNVIGDKMAFAFVCLLFVLVSTNLSVSGNESPNYNRSFSQEHVDSLEDKLTLQQKQIDFLVQQVSELSKVSKTQRNEIDELKKEKLNQLFTVSDIKRSLYKASVQNQWSVRLDQETIDNMAENEDISVIRKGL